MIRGEKINKREMADAIFRSGYLLEQRAQRILHNRGYFVSANDSYVDPDTGKSREIDIYATGAEQISRDREFIFPMLICECENNPQPMVAFVEESPISFLNYREAKIAGIPIQCLSTKAKGRELIPIQEFLGFEKYHHYCKGLTATQYCSFVRKKQQPNDWMATHLDEQHESFTRLINALEFYIDKYYTNYRLPYKSEVERINLEFYYPILILQGPLYAATLKKGRLALRPVQHIQYRKDYHLKGRNLTYQIDVITEVFLPKYVDVIEREMRKAASVIKRKKAIVRKSIEALVIKARKKRAKDTYRGVFELRH